MILQRSGKISCAHGLKESIQLKFHTTQSNQKFNPQESTHDIFHRTRTNNSSEEPRQYKQRTKLGVSQSLTSNYTTCVCVCSVVFNSVTPWAPLSMGYPRQEYWSGLPFPFPGDLPDPGSEPVSLVSPSLAGRFYTTLQSYSNENHIKLIQKQTHR